MDFGIFFSFLLIFALTHATATEFVPVYMWQTTGPRGQMPALSHVNSDTFRELIIRKVADANTRIVVFAEQNLSPEDFSNTNAHTFKYLVDLQSSKHSYLPTVQSPLKVLAKFQENPKIVSINEYRQEPTESSLLIINLNDAKEDEDRVDMLQRHAHFISKTYKKMLEEDTDLLAIYTGYHSSWVLPEEIIKLRQPRSADAEPAPVPILTNDLAFYMNGSAIYTKGKEQKYLKFDKIESSTNVSFTIKFNDTDEVKFETVMSDSGYWYLTNVMINEKTTKAKEIYAPLGFSYHCSSMIFTINKEEFIMLPEFQVQYGTESVKFGDAYDCVGFTSIPIWSGIFVSLILVLILTIGLTMMMDIKTMDRFDDPKGKTIIINATE